MDAGKPIIGMRTATHAFSIAPGKKYVRYDWRNKEWDGGFGRQILGETWVAHHGQHGKESTRGVVAKGMENCPIVRGCEDIWGPTDVYTVRLPLPEACKPVIMGQVLKGMNPSDEPVVNKKNDPMMPGLTMTYPGKQGQVGRVFTTTSAATDLASEGYAARWSTPASGAWG